MTRSFAGAAVRLPGWETAELGQIVLDEVVVSNDRDLLLLIALGLTLLVTFRCAVEFVRSWAILVGGSTLALQWKASLFQHMLKLPLGDFERRHVGDVASRFASIDRMQQTLSAASVSGLVDGVMALALIAMMWIYDGWLAAIAVGTTALYAIMRGVAYRVYRRVNEEAIVYAAQENSHFVESLRGMPSIKALGIGDRRQASWSNFPVDRVSAELRVHRVDTIFVTCSNLLFGLDRVLIIFLGAQAVMDGNLSVGMLVAFLAYKDQFSQRVGQCLDTLVRMGMLSVHGERISDIALAEPEPGSERAALPSPVMTNGAATLNAQAVEFRYGDNEAPVVAGFNLEVTAGECVAIVGPSGAGKTTLLKMFLQPGVMRFMRSTWPLWSGGSRAASCRAAGCRCGLWSDAESINDRLQGVAIVTGGLCDLALGGGRCDIAFREVYPS